MLAQAGARMRITVAVATGNFFVDFFLKYDILFFVMGIMKDLFLSELSCEEQFELNAWCDERREADIAAQDADMVAEEMARQSDALLAEDAALDAGGRAVPVQREDVPERAPRELAAVAGRCARSFLARWAALSNAWTW